jgi:hypothetical protein
MPLPIVFVSFCKDSFLANLGKCNRKLREGFGEPTDFRSPNTAVEHHIETEYAKMRRFQPKLSVRYCMSVTAKAEDWELGILHTHGWYFERLSALKWALRRSKCPLYCRAARMR